MAYLFLASVNLFVLYEKSGHYSTKLVDSKGYLNENSGIHNVSTKIVEHCFKKSKFSHLEIYLEVLEQLTGL